MSGTAVESAADEDSSGMFRQPRRPLPSTAKSKSKQGSRTPAVDLSIPTRDVSIVLRMVNILDRNCKQGQR